MSANLSSGDLSGNTQAILLLTAPLIVGRGVAAADLLSSGEYKRLARHLKDTEKEPADLLRADGSELLQACASVIEADRLQRLLDRGFQLSQAVDRWRTRAIWVLSRADPDYPRRLKARLGADAPAVLYGCGEIGDLNDGGLAVVGSRHVDETLVDYTMAVGNLAARAGRAIVSGGAKGVDQAAMRGALESGGQVRGVLADSLEKQAMTREHRDLLMEGRLTLVSPFDPGAGFNVGHAMGRNKLIYALADAALVVSSDVGKGGTWTGATEQLNRLGFVPIYTRSIGERSAGLDALRDKGAFAWPEPGDADALDAVFAHPATVSTDIGRTDGSPAPIEDLVQLSKVVSSGPRPGTPDEGDRGMVSGSEHVVPAAAAVHAPTTAEAARHGSEATENPADALLSSVRNLIRQLLRAPMKDADIAAALEVSPGQAKSWLNRLVDEGFLEKRKKPAGYVVKENQLFR